MVGIIERSCALGTKPVMAINLNIAWAPDGQPNFMSFDEVVSAFHEFGHAIHGLVCEVEYARFGALNSPKDFVEFPAQLDEKWATEACVLANYATHWTSGEALAEQVINKIVAACRFYSGRVLAEFLGAAVLDQAWHQLSADQIPSEANIKLLKTMCLRQRGLILS